MPLDETDADAHGESHRNPNAPAQAGAGRPETPARFDLQTEIERGVQANHSQDAVVVDAQLRILEFKGHMGPYLDPSPGEASLHLLRMAKERLVLPLRSAVQRAAESELAVRERVAALEIDGRSQDVWLEVTPLVADESGGRRFLIVFARENEGTAPGARELSDMEPHEAHPEESKAGDEEPRSANEALQTANVDLQSRKHEMAAELSDLENLLSAVTAAIVVVDQDLRLRQFNTAAEQLLGLNPIDIGRPVRHLPGRIEMPRLEAQVRRVIETLSPITDEVQGSDGSSYSIAARPYRTVEDRIAGAVITLQGINGSEEPPQYAEALLETVRQPVLVLNAEFRVQRASSAFYDTFMVSREETEGRLVYELGNGQWNRPRLRELLGNALIGSEPFHDYEAEHDFPHIGRRTMRLSARRIPQREPQRRAVLLAIEDVTERRDLAEIRYQRLFETAKDGIVLLDAEAHTVKDVNAFFLQLTGFHRHDFVGKNISDAGALVGLAEAEQVFRATEKFDVVRIDDLEITTRSGAAIPVDVVANRYLLGSHPVVQLNIRDISPRIESARALRESEERFRLVVESVRDFAIFQLDAEGKIVTWNVGAERLLGWPEREAIGKSASIVFTPEDIERRVPEREIEQARREGRAQDERWHRRKDGSRFFASGVLSRANPQDGSGPMFTKIMQDITTRKQQEERLQQSLEEKSTLVREVHHRVKNNLQMIVSLLSLQSNQTEDPRLLTAFDETKGRVRAIAQIHEQLYASEDLREVEVGAYLTALARELVALHATSPDGVQLRVSVPEMVLPIDKAIPVGLIANELVLNSLKHGLRERTGRLELTLEYSAGDGQSAPDARLRVRDNGPGFPADFEPANASSMGYQLVNLLLRQLRARVQIENHGGASVTVTFPIPEESAGGALG